MNANKRECNKYNTDKGQKEALSASSESLSSIRVHSRSFAANVDWVSWAAERLTAAGVENARFEAQLLTALALGVSRASVVAQTYSTPTEAQRQWFAFLVTRRTQRVPLAYLRGTQEFYGLDFLVTPDVLIPRPETELLVEKAGERIAVVRKTQETLVLADVGTGSGCIPIALVHTYAGAQAVAFDISAPALDIARRNAVHNGVAERVRFVQSDLLAPTCAARFDMVVSNPPYIAREDIGALQAEVRDYEPRLALEGGEDGLGVYRRLVADAWQALKSSGWLCVEVGQGQASDVTALMRAAGYGNTQTYLDFAGIARVLCAQKP